MVCFQSSLRLCAGCHHSHGMRRQARRAVARPCRAKDHGGDAGLLLGSSIKEGDKIVIIEDVTTSGKSIEETFPIIKAQCPNPDNIEIKGLMVSLNRQEKGKGDKSALEEITDLYGFPANAIVTMGEVVEYLYNKPTGKDGKIIIDDKIKADIENYYKEYGAK